MKRKDEGGNKRGKDEGRGGGRPPRKEELERQKFDQCGREEGREGRNQRYLVSFWSLLKNEAKDFPPSKLTGRQGREFFFCKECKLLFPFALT